MNHHLNEQQSSDRRGQLALLALMLVGSAVFWAWMLGLATQFF